MKNLSTTNESFLKFIRSIACIQLCCWWFRRATHVLPRRLPCETAKTTPGKTKEIFERFDACCECRNYRHRGRTTTNIRPLASDGSTGEANSLTLFEKLEMSEIYAFRKYIESIFSQRDVYHKSARAYPNKQSSDTMRQDANTNMWRQAAIIPIRRDSRELEAQTVGLTRKLCRGRSVSCGQFPKPPRLWNDHNRKRVPSWSQNALRHYPETLLRSTHLIIRAHTSKNARTNNNYLPQLLSDNYW